MSFTSEEEAISKLQSSSLPDNSDSQEDQLLAETGPRAQRIIETLEEEHAFRLDEKELEKILLSPEIADKKVYSINF